MPHEQQQLLALARLVRSRIRRAERDLNEAKKLVAQLVEQLGDDDAEQEPDRPLLSR